MCIQNRISKAPIVHCCCILTVESMHAHRQHTTRSSGRWMAIEAPTHHSSAITLASTSSMAGSAYPYKIATLNNEISLYSMNFAVLVTLWHPILVMLASTELTEVLSCFGTDVSPQLHFQPAHRCSTYGYICIHVRHSSACTLDALENGGRSSACSHKNDPCQ